MNRTTVLLAARQLLPPFLLCILLLYVFDASVRRAAENTGDLFRTSRVPTLTELQFQVSTLETRREALASDLAPLDRPEASLEAIEHLAQAKSLRILRAEKMPNSGGREARGERYRIVVVGHAKDLIAFLHELETTFVFPCQQVALQRTSGGQASSELVMVLKVADREG